MPAIVQELGFEASDAISTLNNLKKSLQGVNTALRAFNKLTAASESEKVAAAMAALDKSAARAKASVKKTGEELKDVGNKGQQAAQKITIGFSGLAKALVAREVVQALNRIKQAILDSADAAAEFEISIARISNIAQGPGSSINQLTQSLGELSIELGRPSTEVAEAAFEALQNDLGNTRQTVELLKGAAQDLALVTGGTLTQSINTLSSVLKAYNLEISEADRISDVFFAAIDKGRITLDELENSLGKITPLAARLDVNIENVAAAMAAITQQGTSAAVANTQLRSIFQKLIRPTEELQGAFDKLGVQTFNELIARSGDLQSALEQIAGALNNDDRAIAKAFGRLRGQLGVFNLLANEGIIFKDTLDAISNSAGSAAEAADVIRGTDAFRGQQAAEEFNKTLREIGESVLDARTAFTEFANSVLPEGQSIASVMGFIATGAIALGSGAVIGSITAFGGALLAALAPIAPFIVAAAAGFGIGTVIDAVFESTSEKLERIAGEVEAANDKIAESSEEALKRSNLEIDQLMGQRGEAVDAYVTGLTSAFEKETQVLRDAAKRADAVLGASFSDFEKGIEDIFSRIEGKLKNVQKDLKSAQGKQKDAQQNLDDFRFDRDGRNLTATQKFNREMDRAGDTARDLKKALKGAEQDPDSAAEAGRLAERLQEQARAIREQAEQDGNRVRKREGIARADELEEQALEAKLALSKNEVDELTRKEAVTDSILIKNKIIKDELLQQLAILKDQVDILDDQGKIKTPQQKAEDLEAAEGTAKNIADKFGELTPGIFDQFGEQKNLQKIGDALDKAIQQSQVDFSNIAAQLKDKINEPEYKIFVEAEVNTASISEQVDASLGAAREAGGINPVARQENARKEAEKILRQQTDASTKFDEATKKLAGQTTATTAALGTAVNASLSGNIEEVNNIALKIQDLQKQLQDPELSKAAAAQIESQLVSLKNKVVGLFSSGEISQSVSAALQEAIKGALIETDITETLIELKPQFDEAEITALKNLIANIKLDTASFDSVEESVKNTATSAGTASTNMGTVKSNTAAAVGPMNSLADAAERLAAANVKAASAKAVYHGGQQHLAAGGRGQDKIPAMLSQDEFVVNARSSRQFFSQIQAMNAGQSPQFRETGGPVTSIGDIHVNVVGGSGSENPDVAGRQIANSLRRELRRNTSAL